MLTKRTFYNTKNCHVSFLNWFTSHLKETLTKSASVNNFGSRNRKKAGTIKYNILRIAKCPKQTDDFAKWNSWMKVWHQFYRPCSAETANYRLENMQNNLGGWIDIELETRNQKTDNAESESLIAFLWLFQKLGFGFMFHTRMKQRQQLRQNVAGHSPDAN